MNLRATLWVAIFALVLASPMMLISADDSPEHPRKIVSITVCNADSTGAVTPACGAAYDTERAVLAPGLPVQSINQAGDGTATDEHSTVFAPGSLGDNTDYLFFLAGGSKGVNSDIGLMVLSSPGPDAHGQWTAQPATAQGYGNYSVGPGQIFMPPMKPSMCPDLTDKYGNPFSISQQDQTFDLNYAVPGSVFKDPSGRPGHLLMVYEGTNDCIGTAGGKKLGQNSYQATGIATSLDGGRTWPRYASKDAYMAAQLPLANPVAGQTDNHGPRAPFGAMGQDVCMGNSCFPNVPGNYGRYEVVSPPIALDTLMHAGVPIGGQFGYAEPSAFVDDVQSGDENGGEGNPYVYIVAHYLSNGIAPLPSDNGRKDDLAVARARLDGNRAQLEFSKWNGAWFPNAPDGRGGPDAPMLPSASDGNFTACGDNASKQGRSQGSISYVEETHQYLLLFVCTSLGDPALGAASSKTFGSAWFYSINDDLNNQSGWSLPKEIEGSYAVHTEIPKTTSCELYNGWYPNIMSLEKEPGHLSTQGYVFYMSGSLGPCDQPNEPNISLPPRTYSSRQFTIVTAPR
ncbi:MAG: hypothetical protein LAO08_17230 [Acidobacteriia bacterium]|nr:hypothetical protein [Terriglobia bacterium]